MAPLALLVALACVITAATGYLAARARRGTPAAGPLTGTLAAVTLWGAAVVAMNAGTPRPWLDLLVLPQYLGVAGAVLGIRLFADAVTGRPPRRRRVLLLSVEPVLLLVVVALDPWWRLLHATVEHTGDPLLRFVTPGPLFWVHSGYSYLVVLSTALSLWQLRRSSSGLQRRQAGTMLLAVSVPFATNLVVVLTPAHLLNVDVTPVAFAVTGVLFAYAVLQQDLLRLVPVARSLVVDTVSDAVLVVDERDQLVDVNPAGRDLLDGAGCPGATAAGRSFREAVDPALVRAVGEGEGDVVATLAGGTQVDVRTRWIRDPRGRVLGRVVVARDVTAQLAAARAVEEANARLRAQVATIEELRAELAEEAARDPLTGLRNRRRFVDDLAQGLAATAAAGQPLSLVLLDVDRFKGINDTHGHAVGDDVLVGVAQTLSTHARPEDVVRYGGEEFVVLLPHLDADAARARAEVLRAACGQVRVEVEAVRITVSAGVATSPDHGSTPDELLLAADRALYEAKEGGRDQVVLAD
ncbi:diguanylate cyclase (GGDEF)-like protein [Kineococcus radiotolerans]|uniref:Diguanylate cyclase (GGDEF)-like protein n=1 Tax=Kineococcus radiotolerans TaxID=131568 RepID=A0A7W4XXF8_KINRA|nr:diguanylate cyclase [Kineococcus radiotolerans]MBB2901457.1 diguanylate cyclase (GGDEF)-like protein [Kineococcus radiotolerans]